MTKRNPKQESSNLFDCKPQIGSCPINCNECFYNRQGAFYIDINETIFPTTEEVGDGIVRVNCGHDSNIERDKVIKETACYARRFFNTSLPRFDFPAPVVFTANRDEETTATSPAHLSCPVPPNLMYVRLRVSITNLHHIDVAVAAWTSVQIPVVLTFMAYYSYEPADKENYIWKKRHINSYWCATKKFMKEVLQREKIIGGRLVTICGTLDSPWCRDCRKCEMYYWQNIKHMQESNFGENPEIPNDIDPAHEEAKSAAESRGERAE